MVLFRNVASWIDRCEECFSTARREGLAALPGYVLDAPPGDLPSLEVILAGQPGSGKSTLGNMLLGYRARALFSGREPPAEPPRFQEELVSLARRFPDRYRGSQSIPSSELLAHRLASIPIALGVRFTEVWGLGAGPGRPAGEITARLIDADPGASLLVVVVRADQQIDAWERDLLARIVPSPWKDSVVVVLNLRTRDAPDQIIRLKGFVEEQCIGIGLRPRGLFAIEATTGTSPLEGETERFGETLTRAIGSLWTREQAASLRGMMVGPLGALESGILAGLGYGTVAELGNAIDRTRREIDSAIGSRARRRDDAIEDLGSLATRAAADMARCLEEEDVASRPREILQHFRREAIQTIERAMGPAGDTSSWPVPDLKVGHKPGVGCVPIGIAAILGVVALGLTIGTLWILAAVFAGVAVGIASLSTALAVRARTRWRDQAIASFGRILDEQGAAGRALIERLHEAARDASLVAPDLKALIDRLEKAHGIVERVESLAAEATALVPALATRVDADPRPGRHARALARALAPSHPMNEFFHESGLDLDAPDLFGRACTIDAALKPLAHLRTIETVRGWLRPPIARRERPIYSYIERLRFRWDDIAARTRSIGERLARKIAAEPAVRASAAPAASSPRLAIVEEALEGILGRVLDEAGKHAFKAGEKAAVELVWSLGEREGEKVAVLDVELHGTRGFDAAGRRAFDSGRGGLARFLSDEQAGALGWCSEIEIASRDGTETWVRRVHERSGAFGKGEGVEGDWATRLRLVFPAVVEEG